MTEATVLETHLTAVPAETSVFQDVRDLRRGMSLFYERHHVAITVTGVIVASLVLHRAILRRELKHLNFSVEIQPFDEYGELSV